MPYGTVAAAGAAAEAFAAAPKGDHAIGRYLQIYWELDDAWYDGLVEAYNPEGGSHTVRRCRLTLSNPRRKRLELCA